MYKFVFCDKLLKFHFPPTSAVHDVVRISSITTVYIQELFS